MNAPEHNLDTRTTWIRPGWVAYTASLLTICVLAFLIASGLRLPLLVLGLFPIVMVGIILVVVAFLPAHLFEHRRCDTPVPSPARADTEAPETVPLPMATSEVGGETRPLPLASPRPDETEREKAPGADAEDGGTTAVLPRTPGEADTAGHDDPQDSSVTRTDGDAGA